MTVFPLSARIGYVLGGQKEGFPKWRKGSDPIKTAKETSKGRMPLALTGMWPKHGVILRLLEKVPGGYLTTAGGQMPSHKSHQKSHLWQQYSPR